MDLLKKIWPTAFKVAPKDTKALVVEIIILIVAAFVAGIVIGIATFIRIIPIIGPIIAWLLGIAGGFVDLYCVIGIALCVLNYFDLLK